MKTMICKVLTAAMILVFPAPTNAQNQKSIVRNYMTQLPHGKPDFREGPQKYRITAIYTNRDLYGNFTGKTKISGDYTCGFENQQASWSNVFIAGSNDFNGSFPDGAKQEYMSDFRYVPSAEMLEEEAFKGFPASPDNVLARNLIWDMFTIEGFAWDYADSLVMNRIYTIPDIKGEFQMAGIGTYSHASIQVCWTGISYVNNELCAVIEYRAVDNMIKLAMDQINTRGTEQYWGTTWVSLKTKQIEKAEMYGGTIQEIEVKGFSDKFLAKTIRELWVERIK